MRLKIPHFLFAFLIVGALILGGCTGEQAASSSVSPTSSASEAPTKITIEATTQTTTGATPVSETTIESIPGMKDLPRLEGKATVVMTVKGSPITIELDGINAPITAGNFVDLVQRGVYDGLAFHRVIREPQPFVAQGGDPQGKDPKFPADRLGTGGFKDPKTGNERQIPLEIKAKGATEPTYGKPLDGSQTPILQHKLGTIAMARSQMPDSASSQFYFTLADQGFLDGNYAVFGNVTEGMDVVNKIKQGDRIETVKVTQGSENLKNGGK